MSETEAVARARKFNGFHATGGPTVSILADGRDVVYLIEFSREDGDTHLDAIVDALNGFIVRLIYYDIEPFDRENALLRIQKEQDAARTRVRCLALEGRRLEAMRLWRKTFDCSMLDAKAEVERICRE